MTFGWEGSAVLFFCLYALCDMCVTVQSLDLSKPYWTLRVVIDKSKAENIEVKKDTERMDQIKAIKKAWEMAEPGRSAKVTQKLCLWWWFNIITYQQKSFY